MSNRPNTRNRKRPIPQAEPKAANKNWFANPIIWVGGLIAVALAVTIGLTVGGGDGEGIIGSSSVQEQAFAEIIGDPLPQFANNDVAIGTEAPVIVAQNFGGEIVQIGGDGVARLYGFFAHWCPHCQQELPRVSEWLETNDLPPGVEVVAISTSNNPGAGNYPPSAWFEREEWSATVVIDDEGGPLANGFGLTGFPFWVAVDAEGNVVRRVSGELPISDFEALISLVAPPVE